MVTFINRFMHCLPLFGITSSSYSIQAQEIFVWVEIYIQVVACQVLWYV